MIVISPIMALWVALTATLALAASLGGARGPCSAGSAPSMRPSSCCCSPIPHGRRHPRRVRPELGVAAGAPETGRRAGASRARGAGTGRPVSSHHFARHPPRKRRIGFGIRGAAACGERSSGLGFASPEDDGGWGAASHHSSVHAPAHDRCGSTPVAAPCAMPDLEGLRTRLRGNPSGRGGP